jgi:hypothetical protein
MTHLYTILVGGTVLPGGGAPAVSAIAWAGDTVIGLGSDDEMRGLSRGDSLFIDLGGASVVPLGEGDPGWPGELTLEIGGPADLAILAGDPRASGATGAPGHAMLALVRGGQVVAGRLPGTSRGGDHGHEIERAGSG